jgi:hypothetical protein
MSINITTERDVIKIIKYSRVLLNRIKTCEGEREREGGERERILLLFIIVRYYCYYFINGLRVVNVYLIRLLLHFDYDGAKMVE